MKTLAAALLVFASIAQADMPHTASGIPIDTDWKVKEYAYAVQNVVHPSWGITHSERDYQVTKKLADAQGIALDLDVLFACAFLHDLGGIGSFAQPGVDHAVRSAQLAEPLLQAWGFPMEKWAQVKEMILGTPTTGPCLRPRRRSRFATPTSWISSEISASRGFSPSPKSRAAPRPRSPLPCRSSVSSARTFLRS
jgi:hypothetical protein